MNLLHKFFLGGFIAGLSLGLNFDTFAVDKINSYAVCSFAANSLKSGKHSLSNGSFLIIDDEAASKLNCQAIALDLGQLESGKTYKLIFGEAGKYSLTKLD